MVPVAAAAAAGVSVILLVTVLTRSRLCPAVYPAPAWCFDDSANSWLAAGIVIVMVVTGAIIALDRWVPQVRRWSTPLGFVLVAGVTLTLVITRVVLYGW